MHCQVNKQMMLPVNGGMPHTVLPTKLSANLSTGRVKEDPSMHGFGFPGKTFCCDMKCNHCISCYYYDEYILHDDKLAN